MANEYTPQHQEQAPQENRTKNPGQFQAGDPRTREAGKKGGQASRGGGRRSE